MRSFNGLRLVASAKTRPLEGRQRNPVPIEDPRGCDFDDASADWLFGDLLIPDRGPLAIGEGCGGNEFSGRVQEPARAFTALSPSEASRQDDKGMPKSA